MIKEVNFITQIDFLTLMNKSNFPSFEMLAMNGSRLLSMIGTSLYLFVFTGEGSGTRISSIHGFAGL
jgi:hypothetical protein